MRLALLTTDNREHCRKYELTHPYFGTAPEALLEGFALLPELDVHVVTCTQKPMRSPAKLADNVQFHSIHVPKLGWMRTGYQGCVRAIRRKLQELKPDIVHGQGTERECAISAVFSGFPNVVTIHGNMAELARMFKAPLGSFHWLAGKLEDFALPRSDGVFCNSEYTEELVKRRGCRTWRVPNPIRGAFFAPMHCRNDSVPTLLNIGVISPRKRQLELLDLVRRVRARGEKFKMVFIGDANPNDSYAAEFLKQLREEPSDSVTYLGTRSTTELVDLMDSSSALVHVPSEEAFGLVVAEGLARNLRLFASRVGGIVDIAGGVNDASLFDVNDWGTLEIALLNWLKNGAARGSQASETMRQRYHPTVVAERHLSIYNEVLRTLR